MAELTTTNITPTANASNQIHGRNMHILHGFWIFELVYIFLVAIATVVINAMTLYTIYKDPLKCFRNPLARFVTGVIAADFLTGLIGEPLLAFGVAHYWNTNNISGLRVMFLGYVVSTVTVSVSFLTLLALAISQLLAIGWTRRYDRCVSIRSVRIGISTIWFCMAVVSIVLAVMSFWLVIGVLILEVAAITIALVIIYIVTYHVFRNRVNRHENPLENQLVTREFLRGTFWLVFVQIVTVWPYVSLTITIPVYYATGNRFSASDWDNIEIVRTMCTVLFLAKFVIDPIILVWRIPKYGKSMKMVHANWLGRCGCNVNTDYTEGRAEYIGTRDEDFDGNSADRNVNVEVI